MPRASSTVENWLQNQPLFEGFSAPQLKQVAATAQRCSVARGCFFFHQGDPAAHLYLLMDGTVRIAQVTPDGQQVTLRVITPGQMFGAVAVLGDVVFPASAEAVEDSTALAWEGRVVADLMDRFPRLARNALGLVAGRLQEMQERYRELATERAEQRVARAVLRLVRQAGRKVEGGVFVDLPLSCEDMAELTGTTLYTVSRILSSWERRGLVESVRHRILIRVPHALVAIAEDLPTPDGFRGDQGSSAD